MTAKIHPTAFVDVSVKLGKNVHVGPFSVIEAGAEIGDDSQIGAHVVLHSACRLGARNVIHPHAVLGGLPQDLGFDANEATWVEMGDGNVVREGVTINRATKPGGSTRVGSHCYLMNNSHIGHDCAVGDHVIFASGACLGGHVVVGDRVFLGGGAMTHQFCRIGSYAMIQGLAGLNKDALPFMMVGGRPGKHYRLNLVGMRRAGIDGERLKVVSTAMRRLRHRSNQLDDLPDTPELIFLRSWLAGTSKRGILGFVDRSKEAD